MAALESPENHIKATATSTATTSSSTTSDLNFSVRRRSTTVTDSPSTEMMESEDLKSNGKECDKVTNENRSDIKFNYRPSMPAHRGVRESPLSSDAIFKQSHAGLFNLCIVVLVAINSRLIIENIIKYGWLINGGFWFSSKSLRDWPLFMCCLSLPAFPFAAYLVEKLAYQNYLPQLVVVFLHTIITTGSLLYPVLVILRCDSAFLSGVTLMLFSCIVWLKLVSYAHTNSDLRAIAKSIDRVSIFEKAQQEDVPSISPYVGNPYDTYFKSLVYFMVAPTLCYQSSYPRTESVRKGWVVQQFVKLIIFTGFMGFIIEQYINPIVKNSQHPFKGNLLYAIERVLKLSVPNLYVWLCMFYCFFHLWLNILAELLCFGDREFYKDWWNARTVEEPVHKWMVRHIYFPCLRNKIPKGLAILIAFLVSAVFHELCIAVPCHVFKLWAFIGIMLQVPLVVITKFLQNKFRSSMVGNMIFWLFFSILGQPMCVLLYYHDLMNRKGKTESR
ncbi:diacylglycerol O-acyltransferase 1 isoform X2 [Populus trichocarpa]|uniref:O-acyltransferase n=1 Tax=Populus trichocarpa TaxID=3694 RepID=A0A3N7GEL7_POPTR|nr:diacylglycerol O-acyltransferase 1 isoform X2 [Populus trichocarpa]|eukprot:XP_024459884.1 diacylglycerol O-acyltransferase 1 isoform X2 [Populus trichocarpa]